MNPTFRSAKKLLPRVLASLIATACCACAQAAAISFHFTDDQNSLNNY